MISARNDLKDLLDVHTLRLQELQRKRDRQGNNTPVTIITEIQDVEAEIKRLKAKSSNLKKGRIPKIAIVGVISIVGVILLVWGAESINESLLSVLCLAPLLLIRWAIEMAVIGGVSSASSAIKDTWINRDMRK